MLLLLFLAVAVGVGWVGRDSECTGDDCGMGAEADGGNDVDACPVLCGGCARVAVTTTHAIEPAVVIAPSVACATFAVASPTSSPPPSGLFRPPRA